MSTSTLIRGGRLIDPAQEIDAPTDVLIVDGKVAALGTDASSHTANEIIDARDLIVTPGLIDMHVHLREPGGEAAETIESGTAAAAAGGFTAVACMPNTIPALDNATLIHGVLRQAERRGHCRVHPIGALTHGRDGHELADLGLMTDAGAVGFSDDGCGVADTDMCLRAMTYCAQFDQLFVQHCEDDSLAAGGAMHAGAVSEELGIPGITHLAEEAMIARDLLLAEAAGVRYHVAHISTKRAVELVREAKSRSVRVTTEVCPHHLLLTDAACRAYDTHAKMNPPLRTQADVEACIAGVADGTIDCLITDHAPHTPESKQRPFAEAPFGIIGLESALALFIKALVDPGHISWSRLIHAMSTRPAELLKLETGNLKVGAPADVTLIDPQRAWTITASESRSKSRNTPFDGWKVTGCAVRTLIDGTTRFQLDS